MIYKPLSEVAGILNGFAFKSVNYVESGIRVMRIANVQDGYITDEQPCYYPISSVSDIQKYILNEGDLLISLTGNVGRVGMIKKELLPAALNQRLSCIRTKDNALCPKYLFYYFRRKEFIQECIKASKGVAQLNLSTKWLEHYSVPVPPIPEQSRIVSRIEELFSELDKAVETLQTTKKQLAVYRQAVLKEAFEGIDKYMPLSDLCDSIFDGPFGSNLKTEDYQTSGIRVVRLENIKNLYFDDTKKSYIKKEKYEMIARHTVYPSDIIMSTFLSDEIKVCKMPTYITHAVNKADCVGIRVKKEINTNYILYYLASKNAYQGLIHLVHGATRPRVNTKQIKTLLIPICSENKQLAIVKEIEDRLSECDNIQKTVDTALQQADAMRQSILKQAFEGRL